jgi:DNA-directed RNA polymerase specialized sigma24 family protein
VRLRATAANGERRVRVREAYESLSEPMRVALKLRMQERMTPDQVGRVLGLTAEETRLLLAVAMREWHRRAGAST